MARIKLNIPDKPANFKTQLQIRITDLNYGNHMGNQMILEYCHEARVQFYKYLGQTEIQFLDLGTIMSDAAVVYKNQGHWQDNVNIEIFVDDINDYGFDIIYQLSSNEKEIARAKTGIVFFDYERNRIAKAPENLSSIFFPA